MPDIKIKTEYGRRHACAHTTELRHVFIKMRAISTLTKQMTNRLT